MTEFEHQAIASRRRLARSAVLLSLAVLFPAPVRTDAAPASDEPAVVPAPEGAAGRSTAKPRRTDRRVRERNEPAMFGYCPVSYFRDGKATRGNPELSLEYQGEAYHFADEAAKDAFKEHPEKYAPRLSGWCAMALGGPYGNSIEGDPEVFSIVEERLYVFSSERAKRAYEAEPAGVIEKAERLFHEPRLQGYCPVSYFAEGKALRGDPALSATYKRRTYQFASSAAKESFLKDPDHYLPQYNGYCAVSLLSRRKLYADPAVFRVQDGKLYLFLDETKRDWFDNRPEITIEAADTTWSRIRDNW